MKQHDAIPILGAISLNNEYTREYTRVMESTLKTLKPLPSHSIIGQQFVPHVLVMPTITESTTSINNTHKKGRKTRKRKRKTINLDPCRCLNERITF